MTKEQIQEFTRRITQENHSGLILVLCDMVRVYTQDALHAFEEGDETAYMHAVEQARCANHELMDCFEPGDPRGRRVICVLRYIYGQYVTSLIKRSPVEFEACLRLLDKLQAAFEQMHSMDTEGAVMKNAHQVYAGLTYGRGTLNESAVCDDYSKRGFQV